MRLPFATFVALAAGASVLGCGSHSSSAPPLPHFDDLSSAPAVIQTAARAVVRVATAGALATGSFVSPSGVLVTNNHVLGVPVCPIEGCAIQITFMHQRGAVTGAPQNVFAVPISVDEGLDLAVVQLYDSARDASGLPLQTPDYLAWNPQAASALIGAHVTIVGHPEGKLKKWTDGVVTDAFGSWFSSTAYILPGDSGSPVLDDLGRIVGLIHHQLTSEDMVTGDGVEEESLGTASAPLTAAMGEGLPATMISIAAPETTAFVVQNHIVYLNGGAATAAVTDAAGAASATSATTATTPTNILSLLGSACDAALADVSLETVDQLSATLAPCYAGESWIECRGDRTPSFVRTECPSGADVGAWTTRYEGINQRFMTANGEIDDYAVSFAIAALATTQSGGVSAGAATLQAAAASADHVLDFSLGYYLSAFDVASYGGMSVAAFEQNYASVPDYQRSAEDIAAAGTWLASYGSTGVDAMKTTLATLAADPQVTVGAKLWIEEYQYESGWIQ